MRQQQNSDRYQSQLGSSSGEQELEPILIWLTVTELALIIQDTESNSNAAQFIHNMRVPQRLNPIRFNGNFF